MHRAILTPREQRSEPSGEPDRYAAARRGAAAAKQINDLKISRAECEKLQAALAAAEKKVHLYERQASSERSRRAALASTLRQRDQQLTHTLHDAAADSRHHAAADRQQARATERALQTSTISLRPAEGSRSRAGLIR